MKVVVIGGTGSIGSKVVQRLRGLGHEAVAAAPSTGIDIVTGEGLAAAMAGARAVIDVSNSPSFENDAALTFFQAAGRNILAAEQAAGVGHHVTLGIIGTERLQASGYFRGKLAQEAVIEASAVPYTILRSAQFFPFIAGVIQAGAVGDEVHLSSALVQPVAIEDVADALVEIALGPPANRMIEIAGPQAIRLDRFAEQYLRAHSDDRRVVGDPAVSFFGAVLDDRSLTPGPHPRLGGTRLEAWLGAAAPAG